MTVRLEQSDEDREMEMWTFGVELQAQTVEWLSALLYTFGKAWFKDDLPQPIQVPRPASLSTLESEPRKMSSSAEIAKFFGSSGGRVVATPKSEETDGSGSR